MKQGYVCQNCVYLQRIPKFCVSEQDKSQTAEKQFLTLNFKLT